MIATIGPEVANHFALARLELDNKSAEEGWTLMQKEAAVTWLDSLLPDGTPSGQYSELAKLHPQRVPTIFSRGSRSPPLDPPAREFALMIGARFEAARETRIELSMNYAWHVADYVERIWLQARTLADLQPARDVLARFRALSMDPTRVQEAFPRPRQNAAGMEVRYADDDALSALLLFSGPEPLLFPDPIADPAGYKTARLVGHNLVGWPMRFCQRPRVELHVNEFDRRFSHAGKNALRDLERLILAEAQPSQLQAAGARLEIFRVPTSYRPTARLAAPALPRAQFAKEFPADYRDLLARGSHPVDMGRPGYFRPVFDPDQLDAYQAIVELSSAGAEPADALRRRVVENLRRYSPQIKSALRKRLHLDVYGRQLPAAPTSVTSLPSLAPLENSPPRQAVLAVLESIASTARPSAALSQAANLLPMWRKLDDPSEVPQPPTMPSSSWSTFTWQPGGSALIRARDEAIRSLLTPANQSPSANPVPLLLRQSLENAVAAGDLARLRRLVGIERVGGLLTHAATTAWQSILRDLEMATHPSGKSDANEARVAYLRLLRQTTSQSAAEYAARQLRSRALPKTRAAP